MKKEVLKTFLEEFEKVGGRPVLVRTREEAYAKVSELVQSYSSRTIALALLEDEEKSAIRARIKGIRVIEAESLAGDFKSDLDSVDTGITGSQMAIARTGSIVLVTRTETERLTSSLPPRHIALVRASSMVEDLHSTLLLLKSLDRTGNYCVSIITGPSRSGDIMGRLVKGAHGPGEVVGVIMEEE